MSGIQRILVQLSPDNDNTPLLARTGRLAKACGASVELFCSVYSSALHRDYLFDKESEPHAEHGYVKGVEAWLEKAAVALQADDLKIGVDVYWDRNCADGVLRKIQRYEPDLMIAAKHQPHNVVDLIRTDLQRRLIRECPAPLLLTDDACWTEPPVITASVDPFHPCQNPAALDQAVLAMTQTLCESLAVEMNVVHALHTLPHAALFEEQVVADYEALRHKVRLEHREVLERVLQPYGLAITDAHVRLIEGEAHKTLAEHIQGASVSVLVVGHVAKGKLERWLSGSTVERMLDAVTSDLLVVKPPGFENPTDYEP